MENNIIHLFSNKHVSLRNFVRIIMSNSCIKMQHIQDSKIIDSATVNIDEYKAILYKLKSFRLWPIELVLNSSSILCQSHTYNNLSFRKSLSLQPYTKRATNITLYKEYNGVTNVCNLYLNAKQIKLLDTLHSLQNSIMCITSWPSWIVANYFENFKQDKDIFDYSIFIIDNQQYYETICYSNNDYIMMYRKDAVSKDSNKKITESIIESLLATQQITIDDIAIYVLNKNVIDNFATQVAMDMRFSTADHRKQMMV